MLSIKWMTNLSSCSPVPLSQASSETVGTPIPVLATAWPLQCTPSPARREFPGLDETRQISPDHSFICLSLHTGSRSGCHWIYTVGLLILHRKPSFRPSLASESLPLQTLQLLLSIRWIGTLWGGSPYSDAMPSDFNKWTCSGSAFCLLDYHVSFTASETHLLPCFFSQKSLYSNTEYYKENTILK